VSNYLWRAAATDRLEFSEIKIPERDLGRLKQMLVANDPGQLSFYPASLCQLSTMGWSHNHSPIAETKIVPGLNGEAEKRIPIFRFYFDGLIAHIHAQSSDDGEAAGYGPNIVGAGDELIVTMVPFENSYQRENLVHVVGAAKGWPKGGPLLWPHSEKGQPV